MSESDKGENYKSEENEEDKDGPASNGVSGDSKKSGTRYGKLQLFIYNYYYYPWHIYDIICRSSWLAETRAELDA